MQHIPSEFYVYLHRDDAGNIFYVGKGTGRRAWSGQRHAVWHKYVTDRLGGHYNIEIYRDGLSEEAAESLEGELIAQFGEQIVNWINPGRQFDFEALEQYHQLRDANRRFIEETKALESTNLASAVERYLTAMDCMRNYESMTLERGLIADLAIGPDWGDPNILNRLTLCLYKLGLYQKLIAEADRYFSDFPTALTTGVGKQVLARVKKARSKIQN